MRYDQAHDGTKLLRLNYEKKRFLDALKVAVCNVIGMMCARLQNHYDRRKELFPALAMILERSGHVQWQGEYLRVTLRRFRNGEIDYAARRLCEELNAMRPHTQDRYRLPIRFSVA